MFVYIYTNIRIIIKYLLQTFVTKKKNYKHRIIEKPNKQLHTTIKICIPHMLKNFRKQTENLKKFDE